jgi:hypothetical protein
VNLKKCTKEDGMVPTKMNLPICTIGAFDARGSNGLRPKIRSDFRSTMKLSHVLPTLVFLAAAICPAQQTTIIVRLLNGKNGKPVTDKSFNVWLGKGENVLLDTDSRGIIKLDVAGVTPRTIRVLPDFRFDCRSKNDFGEGVRIEYSLDEIFSKGVVSKNLCGKAASLPQPGVLAIFVRPRTFMEKWRL